MFDVLVVDDVCLALSVVCAVELMAQKLEQNVKDNAAENRRQRGDSTAAD